MLSKFWEIRHENELQIRKHKAKGFWETLQLSYSSWWLWERKRFPVISQCHKELCGLYQFHPKDCRNWQEHVLCLIFLLTKEKKKKVVKCIVEWKRAIYSIKNKWKIPVQRFSDLRANNASQENGTLHWIQNLVLNSTYLGISGNFGIPRFQGLWNLWILWEPYLVKGFL